MDFHVGGPVPLNSSAHSDRPFQNVVRSAVNAQRWVLLLGPRQHGKTTAVIRLREMLRSDGFSVAFVDLQGMPPCEDYGAFLSCWTHELAAELGVSDFQEPDGVHRNQLRKWLEAVVPSGPPLVVFLDEAANIPDESLRNTFYGQLRAIANRAAAASVDDISQRLRFVFVGTFRPETLVNPNNSPFNICIRIQPDDLSRDQVSELWQRISGEDSTAEADRVFELVGGQPYLVQLLFSRMVAETNSERRFQVASDYLMSGSDDHCANLFTNIVGDARLTSLVRELAVGDGLNYEPANQDFQHLVVLGVAKVEHERLKIRNELYRQLVRGSSQLADEPSISSSVHFLIPLPEENFRHMTSSELAEIAYRSYRGAVEAYKGGAYRLALAGFGSSLEALLIDFLTDLPPGDLARYVSRAHVQLNRWEVATDPSSFRLATLFKVAKKVPQIRAQAELSLIITDWRNLIHPAVAARDFVPEDDLQPEAQMASSLVCLFRREIAGATPSS